MQTVHVQFIDHVGMSRDVDVAEGTSVMEAAVNNGVPGIDGDCGGNAICGTCHVKVSKQWAGIVGPPGKQEGSMLDLLPDMTATSRLGCQIRLDSRLDGLVVQTPEYQH